MAFVYPAIPSVSITPGITIERALRSALGSVRGSNWQLGFISNLGVACPVTREQFCRQDEALMRPDGTAGQWVVEFYARPPRIESRGGRFLHWYRLRSVAVTSHGSSTLPDTEFETSENLQPLDLDSAWGLEMARDRAIASVRGRFDRMAVRSTKSPTRALVWEFTFFSYDRGAPGRTGRVDPGSVRVSVQGDHVL